MRQITQAVKSVLKDRKNFIIFALISLIFFGLYIAIPVVAVAGNDLLFQLSILRIRDYLVLALLATLVSLNFTMQLYIFRKKRQRKKLTQPVIHGAATGSMGVFGSIVGTAVCGSCLATFFSLIGLSTGSLYFVLNYQIYFLLGAVIFILALLYFTSLQVNNVCALCATPAPNQTQTNLFQCPQCGLTYQDQEIAKKCEEWCKEHKSCNLEIIKQAIKED